MPVNAPPVDPLVDPFVTDKPDDNPAPARARRAVQAAEGPINGPRRAVAFAPADDVVKLSQVAGQELMLYTIQDNEGEYGLYLDCLASCANEPDALFTLRIGSGVKSKLLAVRQAIERGEVQYPVLARFDELALKSGNTCWVLS